MLADIRAKSVMESPQLKIQPKVDQLSKTSTQLPDKQQLLLLGLQLLNKGLKLPTAVVQPQVQRQATTKQSPPPTSQLKKPSPLPSSPVKSVSSASEDESDKEGGVQSPVVIGRKRKRNSNDDLSEVEKREKRYMIMNIGSDLVMMSCYGHMMVQLIVCAFLLTFIISFF